MARYTHRLDIHALSQSQRAELQSGQHVQAGPRPDDPKGVWIGQTRQGSDVVAWRENSRNRFTSYTLALRNYVKGTHSHAR